MINEREKLLFFWHGCVQMLVLFCLVSPRLLYCLDISCDNTVWAMCSCDKRLKKNCLSVNLYIHKNTCNVVCWSVLGWAWDCDVVCQFECFGYCPCMLWSWPGFRLASFSSPRLGLWVQDFLCFNLFVCFASSSLVGDVLLPFACTLAFFIVAYFDGWLLLPLWWICEGETQLWRGL